VTPLSRVSIGPGETLRSTPKIVVLALAELSLLAVIGLSFWYQDLRYALPTPQPANWKAPSVGTRILLPASLTSGSSRAPLALNFYNSDCGCSRFNLDHLRQLYRSYGKKVRFILVLEGGSKSQEEATFQGLRLNCEHCCDTDGGLARDLGVYSTPQAAILDSDLRLVYRGNYNVGRFCTDPRTEFARLALESVVSGRLLPAGLATVPAYGCAIPAFATSESAFK
jgi:hypothetical protein